MLLSHSIAAGRSVTPTAVLEAEDADTLAWIADRLLGRITLTSETRTAWNKFMAYIVPGFEPIEAWDAEDSGTDKARIAESAMIGAFEARWEGKQVGASMSIRVDRLLEAFSLTPLEASILVFLSYCEKYSSIFEVTLQYVMDNSITALVGLVFDIDTTECRLAMGDASPLVKLGFIDSSDLPLCIKLDPVVRMVIEGLDPATMMNSISSECMDNPFSGISASADPLTPRPQSHSERTVRFIALSGGRNVVRISAPDDGRRIGSWLVAVCAAAGRACFQVKSSLPGPSLYNIPALLLSWRYAAKMGACLILDDYGAYATRFGTWRDQNEAAWLRITDVGAPLFWMLSTDSHDDEVNPRLFDYSVSLVDSLVHAEKAALRGIAERFGDRAFLRAAETASIASRVGARPRDLELVMKSLHHAYDGKRFAAAEAPAMLESLLRSRAFEGDSEPSHINRNPIVNALRYDVGVLNTDVPVNLLVDSIQRRTVKTPDSGLGILLWGPPGTGKTAFASYLASQSGLDLLVRRVSDLEHSLVGEAEKAVREAFDQAESSGSVFLLDEADSLLRKRSRAFQRFEVTITNEILTAIDSFMGILVACTNRLDDLDEAALRRFAWKVEFRPLLADSYVSMFTRYFHPRRLKRDDAAALRSIPGLTPGDFEAVRRKTAEFPRMPRSRELVDILRSEAKYRSPESARKIGFQP